MTAPRRRLATVVLAALLVAALPGVAWAAAPIAGDDPGPGCGNLQQFGNSWPIPEDSDQVAFVPGTFCAITANDSDPDGDPLTWSLVTPPAHGDLILDANGVVGYTPDPDYSTRPGSDPGGSWVSDSYVYQVSDGTQTDTATHRFFIAPINDPPTFTYDLGCCGVWAWEDSGPYSQPWASNISPGPGPSEASQTVTFDVSYVTFEGDADLFTVPPAISSDGTLTFTPGPDRSGKAAMTVVAHDDGGLENYLGVASPVANDQSEMVTFNISVDPVDDAPVANDDARTVTEDQAAAALAVAGNDSDPEGDPVTVTSVSGATKGTATVSANDVWYVPHANAFGTDTFTYTLSDGHGRFDTGTVTIAITPVADSPVAADDSAFIPDGPAVAIPVFANDTDVDGDALLISAATQGTLGTVAITGGGTGLTYDPDPLATGSDTFSYTIHDGHGGTDSATVTVAVGRDSSPPTITATTERLPGQTIGATTVRARLSWAAMDPGAGIGRYHLQVSVNGGSYSTIALASPTATTIDRTLAFGSSYRFRIRAKDRAGNVSSFTSWPTLTPNVLQEGTSLAAYTGSWSLATHRSASNGRTRHASSASRRVVVRFIGRDVGWVATRTTASGRAVVRVDGVVVGTVQLDRSSSAYRQLVLARDLSTTGWHTIDIRPLGDGRVDLDAIVTLR